MDRQCADRILVHAGFDRELRLRKNRIEVRAGDRVGPWTGLREIRKSQPTITCGTKRERFIVIGEASSRMPMPQGSSPTIHDPTTA